ncbi:hypothetical protein EHS13_25710 [Paenibacillus psychroresistens]|uniref:Uncharacterized protein n=1 Tax=Paenibacillus psychroresistens TaxID=1778678 RepID=A0A6B8RQD4_9BACL|nr:hypothetical protein [Paenibacillus psychroresistens]QGQ98047.1 hypothetical protein EHS13_25710 [Paenibacillus psychroresistens]
MKKLFFLVLVVLIVGVYFIFKLFSSEPPSPTISVGDKIISSAQGSYCWRGLLNAKCVDMVSPPEIIKMAGLKPIVVSPEAQLKIKFRNQPKKNTMGVNRWISDEKVEEAHLNGNILTLPKEKGVYIYDIFAYWNKGSSSYVFVVEIQ